MKRYSNYSLLTRFFGMYHVHIDDEDKEYYFVVMNSIFPVVTHSKTHDFITERFDLKGSTVGRLVFISYVFFISLTSFIVKRVF